jgi:hypothetical protein
MKLEEAPITLAA